MQLKGICEYLGKRDRFPIFKKHFFVVKEDNKWGVENFWLICCTSPNWCSWNTKNIWENIILMLLLLILHNSQCISECNHGSISWCESPTVRGAVCMRSYTPHWLITDCSHFTVLTSQPVLGKPAGWACYTEKILLHYTIHIHTI